jgi:hypothetical protein
MNTTAVPFQDPVQYMSSDINTVTFPFQDPVQYLSFKHLEVSIAFNTGKK